MTERPIFRMIVDPILVLIVVIALIVTILAFIPPYNRNKAQPVSESQMVEKQCLTRVAEVLLVSKQPGKPVPELELARKLCVDGRLPATRVLYQLNQLKPKLKDGKVRTP